MTLQQILYFNEVAKLNHFTLAAQNLYVAQSSLSHAISQLEQELGVPLFVRKSGRKVELTSYGEAFLPYAASVIDSIDSGKKAIESMRNPDSGVVTVAYSYSNCFALVPMVFNRFYEEHSRDNIDVRVEINHARRVMEKDLQMGNLDLVFSCTPSFEGLCTREIARQELVCLVPVHHPLAGAEQLSIEDIKDEPLIGYYQNWNLSKWISRMFADCGYEANFVEFLPDWSSQLSYVSMGKGIAITSRMPVDPRLIRVIELDQADRFRPVFLHWAANRRESPAVEYVRNYCLDFFSSRKIVV